MRKARDDCYTIPPSSRLHYILVQVSQRTWCVAEYNGKVSLPPSKVFPDLPVEGHACRQWQSGLEFEIVSKPLNYMRATDLMMDLISQRIKERPIILF